MVGKRIHISATMYKFHIATVCAKMASLCAGREMGRAHLRTHLHLEPHTNAHLVCCYTYYVQGSISLPFSPTTHRSSAHSRAAIYGRVGGCFQIQLKSLCCKFVCLFLFSAFTSIFCLLLVLCTFCAVRDRVVLWGWVDSLAL